jgi:hypothetical protein
VVSQLLPEGVKAKIMPVAIWVHSGVIWLYSGLNLCFPEAMALHPVPGSVSSAWDMEVTTTGMPLDEFKVGMPESNTPFGFRFSRYVV